MQKKLQLLLVLLIPINSYAHFSDFLLIFSPTLDYLNEKGHEVVVTDEQQKYAGILTNDECGPNLVIEMSPGNYEGYPISGYASSLNYLDVNAITLNNTQNLFKTLDYLGQGLLQTAQDGILLGNINKVREILNHLETLSLLQKQDLRLIQRIKETRDAYRSIFKQNKINTIKQKAFGATILTSITAAIGTGIYFTYKKVTSKSDKKEKEEKL